jgi:predicted site-specific integrase-resolvase
MKKITKKKLIKLYRSKSNSEVCEILGISSATLMKYLKDNDIPLKGSGRRKWTKITIV